MPVECIFLRSRVDTVSFASEIMIVNPKTTFCSSFEDTEAPFQRNLENDRVVDHPVRFSRPLLPLVESARALAHGWQSIMRRECVVKTCSKEP